MKNLSMNNLNIFREKSQTFRESFKISLDKLQHEKHRDNVRQFNEKNVSRLMNVFRAENCLRRDIEHYMSTLIFRFSLSKDLTRTDNVFSESSLFNSEQMIIYLHERHHLKATQRFLIENDQWWIVNLYLKDQNNLRQSFHSLTSMKISRFRWRMFCVKKISTLSDIILRKFFVKFVFSLWVITALEETNDFADSLSVCKDWSFDWKHYQQHFLRVLMLSLRSLICDQLLTLTLTLASRIYTAQRYETYALNHHHCLIDSTEADTLSALNQENLSSYHWSAKE